MLLHKLIKSIESQGVQFATHPRLGALSSCPSNLGTGKRQSVLCCFPGLTDLGTNFTKLKIAAKKYGLQARGIGG
jgi:creatine kinase